MGIFSEIGQVMMEETLYQNKPVSSKKTVTASVKDKGMSEENLTPPPFEGEIIEVGEDMIPVVINYVCAPPIRTIYPNGEETSIPEERELNSAPEELNEVLESQINNPVSLPPSGVSITCSKITLEGDAEIRGELQANVVADSLRIFGNILGNVCAKDLTLHGTISGSVSCKKLTLCSNKELMSQVKGSIKTDALFTEFS